MSVESPTPPEVQVPKDKAAVLQTASAEVSALILNATATEGVNPNFAREARIFVPKPWLLEGLSVDATLSQTLAWINEHHPEMPGSLYEPGTGGWLGFLHGTEKYANAKVASSLKVASHNELSDQKLSTLTKLMLPKGKIENDRDATDFLVEAGYGLTIALLPPQKSNLYSMAATASAEKTLLKLLKSSIQSVTKVEWSHAGFESTALKTQAALKIFQTLFQADLSDSQIEHLLSHPKDCLDFALDLTKTQTSKNEPTKQVREHLKPAFATLEDAVAYLKAHTDIKEIMAAAPVSGSEIAVPPRGDPNPILRLAKHFAGSVANAAINNLGKAEGTALVNFAFSLMPHDLQMAIRKLAQIGRGKTSVQIAHEMDLDNPRNQKLYRITKLIMNQTLGETGVIVNVMDRSRKTVDPSQGGIARLLTLLYGQDSVVNLQTRQVPLKTSSGTILGAEDAHGSIKLGLFQSAEAWGAAQLLELITPTQKPGTAIASRLVPTEIIFARIDTKGNPIWASGGFNFELYDALVSNPNILSPFLQTQLALLQRQMLNQIAIAANPEEIDPKLIRDAHIKDVGFIEWFMDEFFWPQRPLFKSTPKIPASTSLN